MVEFCAVVFMLAVLGIIFCSFLLVRNCLVYKYRMNLINKIRRNNTADNYKSADQRWDYYGTVSYDEMLFKFWRTFDSFFDMKKFNFMVD